ncbi:hypothetical protein ABT203_18830 [Streptomyces sp900105245]|uniref:hypothetical protein n=1 Tax=Streptomyces sp. 900105245 TaxID=3154379 RepID=UPI00331A6F3E
MTISKRSIMTAAAAAFIVGGVAAPSAPAAPSAAPASTPAPAHGTLGAELDNLRWTPVRTMSGGTVWMLRVSSDPHVEAGGVYFLYNPDESSVAGSFSVGDDVRVRTVHDWRAAVFAPARDAHRIEVRYGNLQAPDTARVVASVTNTVGNE